MKRLLAALMLFPLLAHAAGNDLLINQRRADDAATLTRGVAPPGGGGQNAVMGYLGATNLPVFFSIGPGLSLVGGTLDTVASSPSWASITGKPVFATVATSGAYADLTGIPATFAPAAHTHPSADIVSGVLAVARIPSLPVSQTTGLQAALDGKYPVPTGTTAQYVRGDGSLATLPAPGTGTVTSITAGTGLSGGTITGSGTISLPNTGTAGTYNTVVTDAQGRVTGGTGRSQSQATRALNTVFQVSATRDATVQYAVQCTVTSSIGSGQDGDVFLDIAADAAFTTSVQSVDVSPCSQVVTLAIALQSVQKGTVSVRGFVPAGYYARIRTVNNTGSPVFLYRLGQEVLQ